MNGKENSMPLKKRINTKCVKFKSRCEFVQGCLGGALPSFELTPFAVVRDAGSVSGR